MASNKARAEELMAGDYKWTTVSDAAARVGVNYRTFRYWCQQGKVVHVRLNGWTIRIPMTEVERLLSDRRGPEAEVQRQLGF